MERKVLKTLIIGDNDLECDCKEITLDQIGFRLNDIESYDVIVYKGKQGTITLRFRV